MVYERLKRDILSGELAPGEKMASGVELAKKMGVSHITLRNALKQLKEKNLITQIHGKGTFVTHNALESNKTKNFILFFDHQLINESPFTYISPGSEKACSKLEIGMANICMEFLSAASKKHAISQIQQFDGILFMGDFLDGRHKNIGDFFLETGKPVVMPHSRPSDKLLFPQFATIETDVKQAWQDGITYLLGQGHTRIATIGSAYDNGEPMLRGFKYHEYLDFLEEHGASPDPRLIAGAKYDDENGLITQVSTLMDMGSPPTAIMCFSDFFALKIYKILNTAGIKIPDRVAVMGFCGYPGDKLLSPPLSTVDFKYENIGRIGVELLNRAEDWFNRDDVAVPHIISPHAIEARESTAIRRIENEILVKTESEKSFCHSL